MYCGAGFRRLFEGWSYVHSVTVSLGQAWTFCNFAYGSRIPASHISLMCFSQQKFDLTWQ